MRYHVCFVKYHTCVMFEIFCFEYMLMDISYGWFLRKSANLHSSPDISDISSIINDIIVV